MAATPRRLVIVESPAKATKIASYLPKSYVVDSSRGHVRDLPTKASEVPAKYKGEKWARTGVNVDDGFTPIYVVSADKKAIIRKLKEELAGVDELYLATDEDREGEAIAWHLLAELKPKVPVRRMVFHEITPQAITAAVENTRELDTDLVDAQETRRILDRLYGYEVSPVLWKKVMPKLSAGRVQSVATRLVVDRERERIAFRSASYWDIEALLAVRAVDAIGSGPTNFATRLISLDARRIAQGRDFDELGRQKTDAIVLDETAAGTLATALESAVFTVASVEAKPFSRRPSAPFRTTTLQQEAGRKLGFTTQRTMSVAQTLYEGGYITYMRTDSVTLSAQAMQGARAQVGQLFGADYLTSQPRVYASQVKNAQEAHEAIRPSGEHFQTPAQTGLRGDEFRLYELIWQRTLASQMADAQGQSMQVRVQAELARRAELAVTPEAVRLAEFGASGRTITFPGFLRAYAETGDEDDSPRLPTVRPGQQLDVAQLHPDGHETRPPARYTEPSLVAKLEELEIGRPSTYASIIRTITTRDYVFKKGSALVPTWLAFAVTGLLERHFPTLVDYGFTAGLEDLLDEIARGEADRVKVLTGFYFGDSEADREGLSGMVNSLGEIDARGLSTFPLGEDTGMNVRVGRFGTYVETADGRRANVPDDLPPDELTVDVAGELLANPLGEERELGRDPQTDKLIVAKSGRYGPYVTEVLDEAEDAPKSKVKARTASLFKDMVLESVTLEDALRLLSLPRIVGVDEDGDEITAQNGRFGPYLKKGSDSRSLASEEQLFSVTLDEAKSIYAQPKTRGRAAAGPLRELGADPVSGNPVLVKDGRFGPYVTDGEFNATLRKTDSVEEVTLERAAELLAEKRAKGPAPAKAPRKPAATTKRTVKSTRSATAKSTRKGVTSKA